MMRAAQLLLKRTVMLVYNKNKAGICTGLLGVVTLVLCVHLIVSSSHNISTFPYVRLTWTPEPVSCADKLCVVHNNGRSEQTWQKSSCSALHHRAIRWAYRNEKEMLQAASRASFNTTKTVELDQQNHIYIDEKTMNCILTVSSNNISTSNANNNGVSIREVGASPIGRVAFLFLVRGALPHEALWRRFFATSPAQNLYSVYVHANPKFRFPRGSFFHCKHIPSADVARFSISVVDAMRRLLAYSLLDVSANNQRFVFVCEATIPIRSFPFTYNYLINSNLSYVQAFKPPKEYLSWSTLPLFSSKYLKKGEMWMSLTRHHASVIVGDVALYKKFKASCRREIRICTPDEQYIQTLLSLRDPRGLANKTIMFVDWRSHARIDRGSPSSFSKPHIRPALLQRIQRFTQPLPASSVPYLFARKFPKDSAAPLARISSLLLGY